MKTIYILLITVLSWSLQACTAQCGKPDACTDSIPRIYPDYAGVTFPLNIAPPNFRIGENADYVFLMTYEWGYTYGPPMAVAPLDKVRQVVEYALSQIPAEKLILGIPNYGYDWQLPYERGVTRAQTIGNVQAVDLAVENGALIRYAQTAQSPWFTYKKSGMDHVVWFEDVRSIQAKWKLVQELDLAGAWYWNLMRKFRGNWLMLESPDAGRNT
jgi:spore germination protein